MSFRRIQIISLTNDVYLAAIRLILRTECESGSRDYLFMLANDDKNRQAPMVVQEWVEECTNTVSVETWGTNTYKASEYVEDKPVMPTQSEINASPMVEVIKENLAAQSEAAKAVIVEEKPVEAPKKTRAKPTPKVVETVVVGSAADAQPVVTNPVIVADPELDLSEPELDLTEEAPVITKPELVLFTHGNREQTMMIYPIVTLVYPEWKKDNAYIAKLKPLLIQLDKKPFMASKDSTELLVEFTNRVKALAASIKAT